MALRYKKNYAMRRFDTTKRVTLPNGRTFTACYMRAKRSELPTHIRMNRTYKNRAAVGQWRVRNRQRQSESGVLSTLKKVVKHPLFKQAVKTGAEYLPEVYNFGTDKIKNKKVKRALQSDLTREIVKWISTQGVKFGTIKPTLLEKIIRAFTGGV